MKNISLVRFYFLSVIANMIFFGLLYILIPGIRDNLTQEDKFLENLTAILAFVSFLVGLAVILRLKNRVYRKLYTTLPILGLIVFLDEVSFGRQIFNFNFPVIGVMEIDGLHDFINLFYKKILASVSIGKYSVYYILIILFLFIFAISMAFVRKNKKTFKNINIRESNQDHPLIIFVTGIMVFAGTAIAFDLHIIDFKGIKFLEELFEMNGAFSLLLACLSIK